MTVTEEVEKKNDSSGEAREVGVTVRVYSVTGA